ncbi:MAG: ABC transporter permease [Spirochaetes bacterium]|nr:ABC transporter permease [Spirochaetota bacterium]
MLFKGTSLEIPFLKLKKQKIGLIAFFILVFLYLIIPFQGFLAPYPPNLKFKNKSYQPPHRIHLFHKGKFVGPFVYEYEMINPFFKKYKVNKNKIHKLRLFAKGEEYTVLYIFKSKRHLIGTHNQEPFFLMGADRLGRDLFSRIIFGARVSLTLGFFSVFVSLIGGIVLGGISGYIGGFTDWFIMRGCETIILLPTFYFFLFLRSIMPADISPDQKFLYIMMILAIPGWAGSARGIRNWVLSLKNVDFVIAAQIGGIPMIRIIFKHIIPQIRNILIMGIMLSIPGVILGETGLSFLNLGITEPAVSWGMLMSAAMDINNLIHYPWILFPAFAIILTVFCFFIFGYAVKDALDPKTQV